MRYTVAAIIVAMTALPLIAADKYEGWTREQLIERIGELEHQLEQCQSKDAAQDKELAGKLEIAAAKQYREEFAAMHKRLPSGYEPGAEKAAQIKREFQDKYERGGWKLELREPAVGAFGHLMEDQEPAKLRVVNVDPDAVQVLYNRQRLLLKGWTLPDLRLGQMITVEEPVKITGKTDGHPKALVAERYFAD